MTTQIHDSTTCTLGPSGQPCWMCRFAAESPGNGSKLPYKASGPENQPAGFLAPEPENPPQGESEPGMTIPAPDFEREWAQAPTTHKRYTERDEAEWWLMRGVWLGIQYERERGLVAMNRDLREMQRMARERIGR